MRQSAIVEARGATPFRVVDGRDAAVEQLRKHGHPVLDGDAARRSPRGHAHVNELGCYRFPVLDPAAGRRPLRDAHADDSEEAWPRLGPCADALSC